MGLRIADSPTMSGQVSMRNVLAVLACLALLACGRHPKPPVVTQTEGGEVVYSHEVQPVIKHDDVPVGVDPAEVVSRVTFSHAGGAVGSITTTKENRGFLRTDRKKVYANCANCHKAEKGAPAGPLPLDVVGPKTSLWWRWVLVALLALALAEAVLRRLSRLSPVGLLLKLIGKKP